MNPLPPGIRPTAADRPGVAQPVPERDIPAQPWGPIALVALLLGLALLAGWEWRWRAFGATPQVANSDGLWAMQRRRIDAGEGDATVFLGSSRVLFDVQLPVWERLSGRKPVQLALEGSSPMTMLEDLADDPAFRGKAFVGVTPMLFFSGRALRERVVNYARKESPSQRAGQWLSMHLVEPYFAFDDPDFALGTVIRRQPWPVREGRHPFESVRKLSVTEADRNTYLWPKVEEDAEYRATAVRIWSQFFQPPPDAPPPEVQAKNLAKQIDRAVAAVEKLRARGVEVIFVRAPSSDAFLEFERNVFPREKTWDVLLARTGARGIHFEDHAEMRALVPIEWSHLNRSDAERFTEALYRLAAAP
jgi:hypothetical protein